MYRGFESLSHRHHERAFPSIKQDSDYPDQDLILDFQSVSDFYQNCDSCHKIDKKSDEFTEHLNFSPIFPEIQVPENFSNKNNHVKCYKSKTGIVSFSGSIPNALLAAALSPAKKIFLGHLIRLCSGRFSRQHGNAINLTDKDIALDANISFRKLLFIGDTENGILLRVQK